MFTTLKMDNEKFTSTWHSYADHFQGVLSNLFDTGESSDVTLFCDDQVKFKAHKFILKSCSPVFESILNETNDSKAIVYLRGVNQLELKPILSFIYFGQASFYQERMKEFLKIGKDLQIIDVPEEEEMVDIGENMAEKPQHDVILDEVSSDDYESVDENELESSTARYKISQQTVPSDSSQCPQCNAVFKHRGDMLKHVRFKHEGVSFPCNQCDYKAMTQPHLKTHIESVHEGVKYPCNQCDHKATKQSHLKTHIESVHEGVKYPCNQCDHKATKQSNLKQHIKEVHEGVKYPCSQCNYKATDQRNLKRHVESVHEGMKYPCSQCDYKATRKSYLKIHIDSKHEC